ncbi:DUF1272 domain-containing protein [Sneathiella limimaris]|uniref:DUF1272 domain-containing protein n=1 Tax=Sneathiella limimaris TaxID=1964213 RepID=UPI00146B0838
MLKLKKTCETCDAPLINGEAEAYICTFECTFCRPCTTDTHKHICPNCGGNLVLRPTRPEKLIEKNPQADV